MNPPDTTQFANGSDTIAPADLDTSSGPAPTQCDECGAPVEEDQRYCVWCGAHRRHVNDPAARYLSHVSARSRVKKSAATARRVSRSSTRTRGLGIALALALIPAAAAVGVLAGRSSNNQDAQLIQALAREQASADRASAGSTTSTGGAATSATGSATGAVTSSAHRAKAGHRGSRSHRSGKARSHKSRSSSSSASLSTSKPTAAQKSAGAAATTKVQKSKGKNYVNGQSGLPTTVVVP